MKASFRRGNNVSKVTQLAKSRRGLDSNIPVPAAPCARPQLLSGAPGRTG